MEEQDRANQFKKLEKALPFKEGEFDNRNQYENTLNKLLDDSLYIALSDLYPYEDWTNIKLPSKFYNWQIRACIELCNFIGKEGILSYSENGLSYSKLKDGLSNDLQNEIIPNVGVIKHNTNSNGGN